MLSRQYTMVDIDSLKHTNTGSLSLHKFLIIYALSFTLNGSDLDNLILFAYAMDDVVERFFIEGDS